MTLTDLNTTVDVLTRPWSDVLSPRESGTGNYRPIDYPPLLDMLREAIGASLGRTRSGASPAAERSVLNLAALDLWEEIDSTTRAWCLELSKSRAPVELKDALRALVGHLQAAHASHQIEQTRFERLARKITGWRQKIWVLFDPPVVKELIGPCPACEETAFYTPDGKTTALIAYYWKNLHPRARCQRCGEAWEGESQLISLGKVLGATMDEDMLREMGIAI